MSLSEQGTQTDTSSERVDFSGCWHGLRGLTGLCHSLPQFFLADVACSCVTPTLKGLRQHSPLLCFWYLFVKVAHWSLRTNKKSGEGWQGRKSDCFSHPLPVLLLRWVVPVVWQPGSPRGEWGHFPTLYVTLCSQSAGKDTGYSALAIQHWLFLPLPGELYAQLMVWKIHLAKYLFVLWWNVGMLWIYVSLQERRSSIFSDTSLLKGAGWPLGFQGNCRREGVLFLPVPLATLTLIFSTSPGCWRT